MKKRESNLELMRVVLMCITPAYHLLVYNLILKAAWNDAMGVTLAFTVAGAIPANYAFMAMSSYFLLEERGGTSLRRFLNTAALTATLYLVRFAVIRGLYGFDSKEYMVEGFITKGAWWYMDSYLILLLLYPFLNRFLRGIGRRAHLALAVALFGLLALFFVLGNMTLPGDLTGFLFIYVTMGICCWEDTGNFCFCLSGHVRCCWGRQPVILRCLPSVSSPNGRALRWIGDWETIYFSM